MAYAPYNASIGRLVSMVFEPLVGIAGLAIGGMSAKKAEETSVQISIIEKNPPTDPETKSRFSAIIESLTQDRIFYIFMAIFFIVVGVFLFYKVFYNPLANTVTSIPVVGHVVGDVVSIADKTVGSVLGMRKSAGRKAAKMHKTRKSRKLTKY